ncbi:MAG: hypothetical protein ABSC01_14150 [Verrucomicrobiota bacterium]|jgi:hypothetical protein
MNANDNPSKANSRLSRIKKLSRFLKAVFLIYFVVLGLVLVAGHVKTPIQVGDQNFSSPREIPAELKIYEALRCSLYLLAAIAFYRLLNLYENGIIFGAGNVSQIRQLGILAIFYGVITACRPIFAEHVIMFPKLPMDMLFSPWLIAGCLTIIIAWVMDEGQKIQVEQELTV